MATMRGNLSSFSDGPLDPTDALAEFLFPADGKPRVLQNAGADTGLMDDPSLQLAGLRDQRKSELEDRVATNPRDDAAKTMLSFLGKDIDSDPYTGTAARAQADKNAKDYTDLTLAENPNTPQGQAQAHKEAVALQTAAVEHPNSNVSPFAGSQIPSVPNGVPTGAPAAGGVGGHAAGVGASAPSSPSTPPPPGIDPGRWAQFTSDLTPEAAAKVAGVLTYSEPLASNNALARPEWSTIVGRATQIDPSFNAAQYDARKKYLMDLSAGGPSSAAAKKQSLDMVMHHLDSLGNSYRQLGNGEFSWLNYLEQHGRKLLSGGNPAATAFSDAADAVAGELGNLFKAGQVSDKEISAWKASLSNSATPEEFAAKMKTLTQLINGRIGSMTKQYSDVMGRQAPSGLFLSPESQAIFDKYQNYGEQSIPMIAPDGRPLNVPAHDAARMESLGARRR